MVWGSVISAAGGLLGGLLDRNSKSSSVGADFSWANLEEQKTLAREGIRMRVADAKAAGIHPLYAIGAPTLGGSPVQSFSDGGGDSTWQSSLGAAGQDIGRAIDATRTQGERVGARIEALQLDRAELENELLRSKIAREKAQIGPPLPSGNPYLNPPDLLMPDNKIGVMIDEKPMERTVTEPGRPFQEPGAIPDVGFVKTPTGLAPVPSKDAKERIEDQAIPELMWSLRNNLLPSLGHGEPPPQHALPQGAYRWKWNVWKQEWQPQFIEKGTKFNRE